jgi:hypothetical protein
MNVFSSDDKDDTISPHYCQEITSGVPSVVDLVKRSGCCSWPRLGSLQRHLLLDAGKFYLLLKAVLRLVSLFCECLYIHI